MKLKILLPIAVITAIIAMFIVSFVYFKNTASKISALMDKDEYASGAEGKVRISNEFSGNICFSSCFPFYFERESGGNWQRGAYGECGKDDLAEKCFSGNKIKAFKFTFPGLESGSYRLAIPICSGCKEGDKFSSDKWIYTNIFKIN